uniref:hypothetical protein n=1 Tax=Tenacibaculum soleae TaxID=447689 RepID=UPI002301F45F
AQGRFVNHVLSEASNELDDDIKERMSSFTSSFWQQRNFSISGNKLTYTTKKVHRFQDMKTRQTKNGVIKKKRTQMHNKPIFGHLNNIIRELNFGFTKAIKAKFMQLES